MNYILFNPLAANGNKDKNVKLAKESLKNRFGELEEINLLELDMQDFLNKLSRKDNLVLLGGDGTLNHVANALHDVELPCNLYLFKAGTGNDFLRDIEKEVDKDGLALINKYLKHLPYVLVNDEKIYFVNGVGLGIDGQVCVEVEKRKKSGKRNISYALECIKIALFKYKFPVAKIVIDDKKEMEYKRVWMVASMFGRYFGGGLMIAPNQDRNDDKLTMVCVCGCTRIGALLIFNGIFKGAHVKHKKIVKILKCNKVEVTFDRPIAMQIDGEIIENVTRYIAIKE